MKNPSQPLANLLTAYSEHSEYGVFCRACGGSEDRSDESDIRSLLFLANNDTLVIEGKSRPVSKARQPTGTTYRLFKAQRKRSALGVVSEEKKKTRKTKTGTGNKSMGSPTSAITFSPWSLLSTMALEFRILVVNLTVRARKKE